MPDIFLYSVPSDGTADIRLRDPTAAAGGPAITGTLAVTEAQDAAVFAGTLVYAGVLAATEAQDVAAFEGTYARTALTGRRIRGKRVIYPDELPPLETEAPKIEPLPSLEAIKAKVAEAKQALEAAQIKAKERKAKAKALTAERYDATQAALEQAEANERAWIRRLQDEDDFFLLAA